MQEIDQISQHRLRLAENKNPDSFKHIHYQFYLFTYRPMLT